jgi:predicted Zn-dependent protease
MRITPRTVALSIVALATVAGIVVLADLGTPPPRDLDFTGLFPVASPQIPRSPIPVPSPPVARNVYLVPMGDFPREKAEALVTHYREKFGLTIEITASMPLPDDAFDYQRDQIGAERLLEAIATSDLAVDDPDAVIIGLTGVDMYIESMTWRYAYGLRSVGTHAVASTGRLDYRADDAKQMQRLRKIITKDLGILYYGLMPSTDPRSVLYQGILGPDDLDGVSEDF